MANHIAAREHQQMQNGMAIDEYRASMLEIFAFVACQLRADTAPCTAGAGRT
jgi:hypothetical protein